MVDIVTDLHLHSRYSRAVSPQMNLQVIEQVALQKGIDMVATGDFTHPLWMRELRNTLEESEEGLYRLKYLMTNERPHSDPLLLGEGRKSVKFLLSAEISCIYSQGGKGRRVHNLVFVPSFQTAEKVNKELIKRGSNLASDGRPIIGLSSKNLLELILEIDLRSLLIPAHIWTPWFGIYGQLSGFGSLQEAFGELNPYVYGIETGLSSDPEMNWQIKELETRSILSFSDAHSPAKMGREATVFRLKEVSYEAIRGAIMEPSQKIQNTQKVRQSELLKVRQSDNPSFPSIPNKVLYTIEFYPEEGKYHYSGHRKCNVFQTPQEQKACGGICPVCKRKVTDGVMRRVQELSDTELTSNPSPRTTNWDSAGKKELRGLRWILDERRLHPPFVKIVPLNEIIAESIGSPVSSPKVKAVYNNIIEAFGSEFEVLLRVPIEKIQEVAGVTLAEGIQKVRQEQITIQPGYDGVYGKVQIFKRLNGPKRSKDLKVEQKKLF